MWSSHSLTSLTNFVSLGCWGTLYPALNHANTAVSGHLPEGGQTRDGVAKHAEWMDAKLKSSVTVSSLTGSSDSNSILGPHNTTPTRESIVVYIPDL